MRCAPSTPGMKAPTNLARSPWNLYGSVTTQGKAYRQPNPGKDENGKSSLSWTSTICSITGFSRIRFRPLEQQHFVIATLVRGGVFGEAG